MMTLPLPHGLSTLIDDEDFERCSQFRWYTNNYGYAARHLQKSDGSDTSQLLARFIMDASKGVEVDHINKNRLDNRRSNLRLATKAQNGWNRGKQSNNTSGFKGVSWDKTKSKWAASIKVSGKLIHLGHFTDILAAAAAYVAAANKYHGEFART